MNKRRILLILLLLFSLTLTSLVACNNEPETPEEPETSKEPETPEELGTPEEPETPEELETPVKLLELEDEELLKYLTDNEFDLAGYSIQWVRNWIITIECDHNYPAPGFSPYLFNRVESLRELILKYYNGKIPTASDENELSDLGDDELYQYISDAGVNIKKHEIMDDTYSIEMIRYIIALLEDDIDYIPFVNPAISAVFIPETLVEELRPLVFEYIGLPKLSELKDDALLKCVTDSGIKFYEDLPNESRISILRFGIRWIENSPDSMAPAFGNEADSELFEEVRKFVFEYYDDKIPNPSARPLLSHMGDDELIQYVTAAGIEIPTGYVAANIRALALILEEDINYEPPITSGIVILTPPADFVEAMRTLVRDYPPKLSELDNKMFFRYASYGGVDFLGLFDNDIDMEWIRRWIIKLEGDTNYPAIPANRGYIAFCEALRAFAIVYYNGEFPEPSDENELSDLSDEALLQYVIDAGANIKKNETDDDTYKIELIRYIIALLEDDPDFVPDDYSPLEHPEYILPALVDELRPVVAAYNANK